MEEAEEGMRELETIVEEKEDWFEGFEVEEEFWFEGFEVEEVG